MVACKCSEDDEAKANADAPTVPHDRSTTRKVLVDSGTDASCCMDSSDRREAANDISVESTEAAVHAAQAAANAAAVAAALATVEAAVPWTDGLTPLRRLLTFAGPPLRPTASLPEVEA